VSSLFDPHAEQPDQLEAVSAAPPEPPPPGAALGWYLREEARAARANDVAQLYRDNPALLGRYAERVVSFGFHDREAAARMAVRYGVNVGVPEDVAVAVVEQWLKRQARGDEPRAQVPTVPVPKGDESLSPLPQHQRGSEWLSSSSNESLENQALRGVRGSC
jgi:hypothetical protein